MAALEFPSVPTVGQEYTANGITYKWDSESWVAQDPVDSSTTISLPEIAVLPAPVADTEQLYALDVGGITSIQSQSPTGFAGDLFRDHTFIVRNETGALMTKGTVVYESGVSIASFGLPPVRLPTVAKALAMGFATMPAVGILAQDIANNSQGRCMRFGMINALDTSAFTARSRLYVSGTVAGGLTMTEPVDFVQEMCLVIRSHATEGQLLVDEREAHAVIEGTLVKAGGTTGQVLTKNSDTNWDMGWSEGGSGSGVLLAVEDEGVEELASVTRLNFTGAGVSVGVVGSEATIDIPGGSGSGGSTESPTFDWQRPDRSWGYWAPAGGGILHEFGTDWNFVGGNNTLVVGTVSGRTKGYKFEVGNGTTTTAGWRSDPFLHTVDGLKFEASWSFNSVGAGSTFFCGLGTLASALPGAVEVSTLLNMVGIGFDSTDSTLKIMSNDGSGTATKHTDTGLNIEGTLSPRTKYRFEMDMEPGATSLTWTLTTITGAAAATRTVHTGSISTDLPVNTNTLSAFLSHRNLTVSTYGENVSHGCRVSTKQ